MKSLLKFSIALLALVSLISACQEKSPDPQIEEGTGKFEVGPRFRELYKRLGGAEILGPAISPIFEKDGYQYQYVVAALMIYDPTASAESRLRLAPLGLDTGMEEPPSPKPLDRNKRYIGGHVIYRGFTELYDRLGGEPVVGLPITDVSYNSDLGRIEQYFENLGFYQLESDPPGKIRLIGLGSWICGDACDFPVAANSQFTSLSVDGGHFEEAISRLGLEFTGFPLTEPYVAHDGLREQVFEHVVIIEDPDSPAGISLRPIVKLLHDHFSPLELPSGDPKMYFYNIQSNLGYNIPKHLLDFVNRHSGIEFSGPPVDRYVRLSEDLYRQCFDNYCLDYSTNLSEGENIRLAPLGYTYKNRFDGNAEPQVVLSFNELNIQVQERYPLAQSGQAQEISVKVMEGENPLSNLKSVLRLSLPDGSEPTYNFPPTDSRGETFVSLPPISALNGTEIRYEVCIAKADGGNFCTLRGFLIWGDP